MFGCTWEFWIPLGIKGVLTVSITLFNTNVLPTLRLTNVRYRPFSGRLGRTPSKYRLRIYTSDSPRLDTRDILHRICTTCIVLSSHLSTVLTGRGKMLWFLKIETIPILYFVILVHELFCVSGSIPTKFLFIITEKVRILSTVVRARCINQCAI